jgi:Tfp pilus assembly protein PilN
VRPVNLLPDGQRRRPSAGAAGNRSYIALGVLAALVLMVAALVLTSNQTNARKSQAAAAKQNADQLEAKASSLGAFTSFAGVKETRLSSVRTVAETRFDWERMMREMSRVIPKGSWLTTVDASTAGATGDNATSTTQTGEGAGAPAANLVGCTSKQPEVAKMMVRLRQLHRVEDVKLNQSSKGTQGSDANGAGCGSRYQFDVTVSFSAAAPKEQPRGANNVPASLGGGS